ncbi:MAG: L-2-amino-thiazoline-4-carboxylic acid hydrolase, partial [Dehalococcoidia bacterium]
VFGDGDFDLGVDYVACGNYRFVRDQGAEEFAPYVCMSDIALSDAMGWGLIRTETLADGCLRCDFRFKRGGRTRISSKTPEVQATIERIKNKQPEP